MIFIAGEFIIFVGFPAAGKTTKRKEMEKNGDIDVVISADDIRFKEFKIQFDPEIEPEVWHIAKKRIRSCLSEGKKCLLDGTNICSFQRRDLISIGRDLGAKTKAIVFNIDFDLARVRNEMRKSIFVDGKRIGQTVPNYAMFRMKSQWDMNGMGHTEKTIKNALKNDDFDEIEVIHRLADERDCNAMNGTITTTPKSGRKVCRVIHRNHLSMTSKYYFMKK